uniref:PaaI family thioesterase n=1 Tax=Ndongobacter massiliensis TaxID=1871025 RepID=UPI000931E33D|nr:hotdog domain-containing protein [Ndongobacter massiliensis]
MSIESKETAMAPISIQETYGERFQHCWGCGPKNEMGLHIKSYPSADGATCVCKFTPSGQFTGGVPANLFGGMIAMLFDCHGTASAAWFSHHSKGRVLTAETVIGRFITAHLEVDFKKPVPMEQEITITAHAEEIGERKVIVTMEMEAGGSIRARSKMVAVAVKDTM